MNTRFTTRQTYGTTLALCGVLVAACAPERIPGSTLAGGDVGIAFHADVAAARGSAAPSRGSNAVASYGGGSSSAKGSGSSLAPLPARETSGTGCDWFSTQSPGATPTAPAGWERSKGIGMEGWFAANCISTGELK